MRTRQPCIPGETNMEMCLWIFLTLLGFTSGTDRQSGSRPGSAIQVKKTTDYIQIDTDVLGARINKTGYVSGTAQGSFLDKQSGARDLGFGLHIMDFLLAPGWRDDGYSRDP